MTDFKTPPPETPPLPTGSPARSPQPSTSPKATSQKQQDASVIRRLPFVVGGIAGTALFINRIVTPSLTDSQARSDAIGVIVTAILILVGLLWERVQPVPPDAVALNGQAGFAIAPDLSDELQLELAWASHLLLTNTVTQVVVVVIDGQTVLRRGILGAVTAVKPGAIVERVLALQKPVYLVNLALYPGRIEFDYLPDNTQGVICQPIGDRGVLILGANVPRSYTRQDEKWIEGIADKLATTIDRVMP